MKDKNLIIDGMALLFRHFYATSFRQQFMYSAFDRPTNGVQGVVRHVFKLVETLQPARLIITWDMGSQTIRNDWYPDYKKNRTAPPEELIPQFDHIKEVFDDLGIFQIGIRGYEADDIIGTLSTALDDVIMVSGDRDLLQLLDEENELWLTKKGYTEYHHYTKERFILEHGITPAQFVDVKALMGDASDGYKGVKGVGEKTAFKLIREYGNIDNMLTNLDSLTPALKKKIEADMASLRIAHQLAKIITDVPLDAREISESSILRLSLRDIDQVLLAHDLSIARKYIGKLGL